MVVFKTSKLVYDVSLLSFFFQSSTRKSAILSAAKKAKLKSNPSRVRFAESVDINGGAPGLNNVSLMASKFVLQSLSSVFAAVLNS